MNHRCMHCSEPMHGALCGALFAERGVDIVIAYDCLSDAGKELYHSTSAVICNICIDVLNGASSKDPTEFAPNLVGTNDF